jgi:hypothetical protein
VIKANEKTFLNTYELHKRVSDKSEEKLKELKEENQKLREIANEVLWWETCPDKMKEEIKALLETTEPKQETKD